MNAVTIDAYGRTDVLQISDLPRPDPGPGQLLVRVHAAAVNPKDTFMRKGYFQQHTGEPAAVRMGFDFAGEAAELGAGVSGFAVGDPVYGMLDGWQGGAFAEYLAVDAGQLARKPPSVSFTEAAALPLVSLTALQALRDEANLQPGQTLCINGASGGVGSAAVQIGRIMGATITAVSRAENHDFLRALGADHCLDYREVDVTQGERRYDVFFDVFGNRPFTAVLPILTPHGVWVSTVLRRHVFAAVALSKKFGRKKAKSVLVQARAADLQQVAEWVEAGQLRPIIHAVYSLAQIAAAQAQQETKHSRGKIVVKMSSLERHHALPESEKR